MLHTALVILSYGACILFGIPLGIFLVMWGIDRMLSEAIGKRGR